MMLEKGMLEAGTAAAIKEAATFYFYKHPLTSSSQYQKVGERLVHKYPILKRIGQKPWVSMFVLCSFQLIQALP